MIGNKIADKITSIGKPKEKEKPKEKPEDIYIPPEERQQIIDDIKLFSIIITLLCKNGISEDYKFTQKKTSSNNVLSKKETIRK